MAKVAGRHAEHQDSGARQLGSLKSGLKISLEHVRGATADPGIAREHPRLARAGAAMCLTCFRPARSIKMASGSSGDVHDPGKVVVNRPRRTSTSSAWSSR